MLRGVQALAVINYFARLLAELGRSRNRKATARSHALDYFAAAAATGAALKGSVQWSDALLAAALYAVLMQCRSAARQARTVLYGAPATVIGRAHAARPMLVSFGLLIAVGGLLLSLPKATIPEISDSTGYYGARRVLNCFFTATSAACASGLVVYDTGHDFTRFGQMVILALIQAGGLAMMISGSAFALTLRRKPSWRESRRPDDVHSRGMLGSAGTLTQFICGATLAIEAVAAAALYGMWPAGVAGPATHWFYSVFHAVSAFCNAGFALSTNSLVPYGSAWQTYGVIMPAIVLGGLGFPVLADLYHWVRSRAQAAWHRNSKPTAGSLPQSGPPPRLGLHSRLVLVTTAALIILPAIALYLLESRPAAPGNNIGPAIMRNLSPRRRAEAALFQSVTCRTAGFNTVSLAPEDLSSASMFMMSILMFIGGSPASTAGGVKTVAVAVLVWRIAAMLRRRRKVEARSRQIPEATVRQAAVVAMLMLICTSGVALVLRYTEQAPLAEVLFEATSACGTAGLSTGLTPRLTVPGQLVTMLGVFAGRVGPLTLLVFWARREAAAAHDDPTEPVILG